MAQTIWKGTLSFGLVNVPVALVGTTRKTRVSFRQLHGEDKAPIRLERVCTKCGKKVATKELVKGAEIANGRFVAVTEDELEKAEPESSRLIAVKEFVSAADVDARYRERTYALAPQPGGERAYALLLDALARRGEVAIGRISVRGDENMVAIRAGDGMLYADVLHWHEEIRDLTEVETTVAKQTDLTDEEKELADLLIGRMHKNWDPTKYHDTYGESVRQLVAAKSRGETFDAPTPKTKASTVDLLAALRETLAKETQADATAEA